MRNYLLGFILSIFLTLASFLLVSTNFLENQVLVFVIMALALIQALIQLVFFLHLDQENKPRWNLIIMLSTVSLILVLVVGSLWIMKNLNYNHSHPSDQEIINSEAIPR